MGHILPSNASLRRRSGSGFMVERNANNVANKIISADSR